MEKTFLAAARALPPDERVPYAFEKRIMAALAGEVPVDVWDWWARLLWRAAAPCVAIMLATTVWASLQSHGPGAILAADLEQAVLAPLSSLNEAW